MQTQTQESNQTPIAVIAHVSRVVTRVVDRLAGDRVDYPLLVAVAVVEGLKHFGIESRVMYGQAAWIEILEDHSVIWAGCWGDNFNFWVATQFGEVVDLNTSVAARKRAHSNPNLKAQYSPPMLWSAEVPTFYRYIPEGIAELELLEDQDKKRYEKVITEVQEKLKECSLNGEPDFANEPILTPGRRLLDDSKETFKHFDRALAVQGLPPSPI